MNDKNIKNQIIKAAHQDVPDLKSRILSQARIKHPKKRPSIFKRRPLLQYVSALLILLIAGVLAVDYIGQNTPNDVTADSTVYIDINPSLEIDIDDEDNVIAIRAMNQDGELIINALTNYENRNVYDVIDDIIDEAIARQYITEENPYVMVDVRGKSDTKRTEILTIIESRVPSHAMGPNDHVQMIRGNVQNPTEEEIQEAEDHNVSMMRLRIIESILETSDAYTFDELEELPTGELIRIKNSLDGMPQNGQMPGNDNMPHN